MKVKWFVVGTFVALLPVIFILILKLPVFGKQPDTQDRIRFSQSVAYNQARGVFENRRPDLIDRMREQSSVVAMLLEWFQNQEEGRPQRPLPEVAPDWTAFMATGEDTRVIWFGHTTFLLNLAGTVVLVDPVFSSSASPISFLATRFQAPVARLDELPPVDVILISHDHYDHLDMDSIRHFADSSTEFVVPMGVGGHLSRWGIAREHIAERDWWATASVKGVNFTATPAQHFSGRNGIHNDETLWASWVVETEHTRLFFSGDSGYDTHFKDIGAIFGPFDMAFLENGQYDEAWTDVHMFPHEVIQAHEDLKAERLFPVHWGMFQLAFHAWYQPIATISALADQKQIPLVTPMLGQVMSLDETEPTERWWETI